MLNNFTSLETCGCIIKQLQEASTDIIIVSNEFLFKDDIVTEIDRNLTRGCNLIDVTNLQPMSIIQRMVYGLLERDSFSIRDADHIIFTLLSEYSRGAATIVHMLTSLIKKCDDNRTGFQLAKHQLKLHIAHKRYEEALRKGLSKYQKGQNRSRLADSISAEDVDTAAIATNQTFEEVLTQISNEGVSSESAHCTSTSVDIKSSSAYDILHEDFKVSSEHMHIAERSELNYPTDPICAEAYCHHDESTERHTAQTTSKELIEMKDTPYDDTETVPQIVEPVVHITPEGHGLTQSDHPHKSVKSEKPGILSSAFKMVISYVKGSDSKQKPVTDVVKTHKDDLPNAIHKILHPSLTDEKVHSTLYMYINDILRSDDFSLPAQHLLHCLSIVGSIPLPKFYIDELDKLITEAITTKEDRRIQRVRGFVPEPLVSQLEQGGVIRKYPNPLLYHKDFNPQDVDSTVQLMCIPKLICDAIDSEMDSTDKAVSIMCVQHALETILTRKSMLSMIHLHYLLVLCNELFDICVSEYSTLGDAFVVESLKLKFRIVEHSQSGVT